MARRTVLTSRQRSALFALPEREADLLRHYTLSDEDLQNIEARRRPRNKLGFALQLCVLRHPGRLLAPGEFVSPAVVNFIGRQLDLDGDDLADYAVRSETRHEHLAELRRLYGFRSFSGGAARRVSSQTGSAKKRNRRSRTRTWSAGSSRPADPREPSCRPRRRSSGSVPTRWSTRSAGSKLASPSGSRPGFGATSSICSKRRPTPA